MVFLVTSRNSNAVDKFAKILTDKFKLNEGSDFIKADPASINELPLDNPDEIYNIVYLLDKDAPRDNDDEYSKLETKIVNAGDKDMFAPNVTLIHRSDNIDDVELELTATRIAALKSFLKNFTDIIHIAMDTGLLDEEDRMVIVSGEDTEDELMSPERFADLIAHDDELYIGFTKYFLTNIKRIPMNQTPPTDNQLVN